MSVDIIAAITSVWPTTEAKLSNATEAPDVDYPTQRALAIQRAKHALYGTTTIPAEADIPDTAAYWIADKAVVYLIPLARDYYMSKQRISDSKEGATITYYNKLKELDQLKTELESDLAVNLAAAQEAVSVGEGEAEETPGVSTAGMMIDPAARAYARSVPGGRDWPAWVP